MLSWCICLNGLYDIACAASLILSGRAGELPPPRAVLGCLSRLHPHLLAGQHDDPLARRLLAYWLFTYGWVRVSSVTGMRVALLLAACTYFTEAMAFSHEQLLFRDRGAGLNPACLWAVGTSCVLGLLALGACL